MEKRDVISIAFAALCVVLPYMVLGASSSCAQNIVAIVNDEPVTSLDVTQRQRWISRTNGFGDRMKAALTSDSIKAKFREMMIAANPRSQAEAAQVAEKVKKQLVEGAKQRVLADGAPRKAALDAIVEDKIKLQAAKKLGLTIADTEVEENLSLRASQGKSNKANLTDFYAQFENDGISRKTIQNIVRAQLAWRDVIRRQFGAQISSVVAVSSIPAATDDSADARFTLSVVRLPVGGSSSEAQRMGEALSLSQKFTSCKDLPKQAALLQGASVKSLDKVKLDALPKEVQPYLKQATEGRMTTPVVVGSAIESYALCKKSSVKPAAKADDKPDARQQEYERFSKRYLQQLRREATVDERSSS